MIDHARILQEHTDDLAPHFHKSDLGDVGLVLRVPAAGLESVGALRVTVGFFAPDVIAEMLAPDAEDSAARQVVNALRARALVAGMVPVVVVSDKRVSLIAVSPDTFK